jgi:hypothetical protein
VKNNYFVAFFFIKNRFMDYAVIAYPVAAVRRKPRHSSEMVNQLLFGEMVELLKARGELWVKVRSLHDNYEGWMTRNLLDPVGEKIAGAGAAYISYDMLSLVTVGERKMYIPLASSLPLFDGVSGDLAGTTFTIEGKTGERTSAQPRADTLRELAVQWLNVPYLWGGRTPMGIDCSGFVQVIFKMVGIDLPRDAWQQAQEGKPVKKFRDARPGDLLFFDDLEEIVHVGLLLEPNIMIHASGKVKTDLVNKKGIVNPETKKRVLRLQSIRRVLPEEFTGTIP